MKLHVQATATSTLALVDRTFLFKLLSRRGKETWSDSPYAVSRRLNPGTGRILGTKIR